MSRRSKYSSHLLHLELRGDPHALLDVLLLHPLAGEDDEGLHDLDGVAAAEDEVLGLVEMLVDDLALLGEVIEDPLQVLHAVADVARLVLHHQAEEFLVDRRSARCTR